MNVVMTGAGQLRRSAGHRRAQGVRRRPDGRAGRAGARGHRQARRSPEAGDRSCDAAVLRHRQSRQAAGVPPGRRPRAGRDRAGPELQALPPAVEDGATFEENAVKKALHYGRHVEGLCSPTTPASKWTRSAARRASTPPATPGRTRPTRPTTGCCSKTSAASPTVRRASSARSRWSRREGARRLSRRGRGAHHRRLRAARGGFGYDPLFYYPPFGCTFGEAGDDHKFAVSHRGQALRAMLDSLSFPF